MEKNIAFTIRKNKLKIRQNPKQNILFFTNLKLNNNVVDIPWSGDLKTISIANKLIDNYNVYVVISKCVHRVKSFYPLIDVASVNTDNILMKYIVLSTDNIDSFNFIVSNIKYDICILNVPAIHWIESHKTFDLGRLHNMWKFIVDNVDYITTSNDRMMLYLDNELKFYLGLEMTNRISVINIGINTNHCYNRDEIRKNIYKCNDEDIIFINSGGIWHWTDIYTFLCAFIRVVNEGFTHYKLYLMGMIQSNNIDPDNIKYVENVKLLLDQNKNLLNTNIFYFDWSNHSTTLQYTHGADIGLNINKNTLENIFSQRVRCSDYLSAGIPILSTSGDEFNELYGNDVGFVCRAENIDSYYNVLKNINHTQISEKKEKVNIVRTKFEWNNISKQFIKILDNASKFDKKQIHKTLNVPLKIKNSYSLDINQTFKSNSSPFISPKLLFENGAYALLVLCTCKGNINCDIITSSNVAINLGNLSTTNTFTFVINDDMPFTIKCIPLNDNSEITIKNITILKNEIAVLLRQSQVKSNQMKLN